MTTNNLTSHPTSAHRPNGPHRLSWRGCAAGSCCPPAWQRNQSCFQDNGIHRLCGGGIGVLMASFLVGTSDAHEDYFRADRAWFYVVLLSIGYMVSRGLAKAGSRQHDDA